MAQQKPLVLPAGSGSISQLSAADDLLVQGLSVGASLVALVAAVTSSGAAVYATLAALQADLAHGAGTLGIVYNDNTVANNGFYAKSGASGSGSWALTSLALGPAVQANASASAAAASASGAAASAGALAGVQPFTVAAPTVSTFDTLDPSAAVASIARNSSGQKVITSKGAPSALLTLLLELVLGRGSFASLGARFTADEALLSSLQASVALDQPYTGSASALSTFDTLDPSIGVAFVARNALGKKVITGALPSSTTQPLASLFLEIIAARNGAASLGARLTADEAAIASNASSLSGVAPYTASVASAAAFNTLDPSISVAVVARNAAGQKVIAARASANGLSLLFGEMLAARGSAVSLAARLSTDEAAIAALQPLLVLQQPVVSVAAFDTLDPAPGFIVARNAAGQKVIAQTLGSSGMVAVGQVAVAAAAGIAGVQALVQSQAQAIANNATALATQAQDLANHETRIETLESKSGSGSGGSGGAQSWAAYFDNPEWLRNWRLTRRKLLLGTAAQSTIAVIGDSYSQSVQFYLQNLTTALINDLGDAGGGYCQFGGLNAGGGTVYLNQNPRPSLYPVTRTGSWSYSYYSPLGAPDMAFITSTTAGDQVTLTGPATPVLSRARLFFLASSDGQVQYRWNGGAWTPLALQGSGLVTADLNQLPASGAWELDIQVVSGTVELCGVDLKSGANGVRVSNLGATGSNSANWAGVNAANWQTALQALAPNLVIIFLNTNDQGGSYTPAQSNANWNTIIANVRAALPGVDILCISPAENQRPNMAYAMPLYAAQTKAVAGSHSCAFIDLQPCFGDPANVSTSYGSSAPIDYLNPDLTHPNPSTGGFAICDALYSVLRY